MFDIPVLLEQAEELNYSYQLRLGYDLIVKIHYIYTVYIYKYVCICIYYIRHAAWAIKDVEKNLPLVWPRPISSRFNSLNSPELMVDYFQLNCWNGILGDYCTIIIET